MSFQEEVKKLLLQKGTLAVDGGWVWGWQDYKDDIRFGGSHEANCKWIETQESRVTEIYFDEFDGTDHGNAQKTMLALTHVRCVCGIVKDGTIGIEGSTGDLLRQLLDLEIDRKYH